MVRALDERRGVMAANRIGFGRGERESKYTDTGIHGEIQEILKGETGGVGARVRAGRSCEGALRAIESFLWQKGSRTIENRRRICSRASQGSKKSPMTT